MRSNKYLKNTYNKFCLNQINIFRRNNINKEASIRNSNTSTPVDKDLKQIMLRIFEEKESEEDRLLFVLFMYQNNLIKGVDLPANKVENKNAH